jgi:hypothetical protein
MPTFATPGPIAATVEVAGAQVRVTASDRTDTVVLVEPIYEASRKDVKVADRTKVDFTGGQLSVKTTVPGTKRFGRHHHRPARRLQPGRAPGVLGCSR